MRATLTTTLHLILPAARATDGTARTRLPGALRHTAQQQTFRGNATARACATRFAGNWWLPMLNGQGSHPLIHPVVFVHAPLVAAGETTLRDQLRGAVFTTGDYVRGTDPLNQVCITGIGPCHVTDVLNLDSRYSTSGNLRAGIVPYGPPRNDVGLGNGWFDHEFPRRTTTPAYDTWPGHERWFNQGPPPRTGEYTVWQTLLTAATSCGSLTEIDPGPVVQTPPSLITVTAAAPASLVAVATASTGTTTYARERLVPGDRWYAVPGALGATLAWPSVQTFHAGTYRAVVLANGITVRTAGATLTMTDPPTPAARILHLSARALCLTGDDRLIPGFVIRGTGAKSLLVHGIAAALALWGVHGFLANPRLALQRRINAAAWEVSRHGGRLVQPRLRSAGEYRRCSDGSLRPGSRKPRRRLRRGAPAGVYSATAPGADGGMRTALLELHAVE